MATLLLTPDEFADIALLFLADKAINPDKVAIGNEAFDTFMEKNAGQIKNKLLKYYLDSPSQRRIDYKLIKKVFTDPKAGLQTIRIGPTKVVKGARVEKKKAKGIIKRLVKKILKKEELEQDEINLLVEFLEEDDNG